MLMYNSLSIQTCANLAKERESLKALKFELVLDDMGLGSDRHFMCIQFV